MLSDLTGIPGETIIMAEDGCRIPTYAIPLVALAQLYAVLAKPSSSPVPSLAVPLQRIAHAMLTHPTLIGGEGQFDTDLMKALPGKVIAKFGAEGVFCVSLINHGIGICLKVDDGNGRAFAPAIAETLLQLQILTADERQAVETFRTKAVRSSYGDTVGVLAPTFTLNMV